MLSLEAPQQTSAQSLTQTQRILVVEDEDVIRQMIILALEEEGYEVIVAKDGPNRIVFTGRSREK